MIMNWIPIFGDVGWKYFTLMTLLLLALVGGLVFMLKRR